MNIETLLCQAVKKLLESRLKGIKIIGNWVCDGTPIKGLETLAIPYVYLDVSPRKYDSYTGNVAEFTVIIDGSFDISHDVTLAETRNAYEAVTSLLEDWRGSIAAVKRDLSVNGFDPVGLRLDGGSFRIDRDTKTRNYTQQFTLKGRIRT